MGAGRNTAVVITVEANDDPKLNSLGASVTNDGNAVAKAFRYISQVGSVDDQIVHLSGDQATATAIIETVSSVGHSLEPNDPFFLYYSGHGGHIGSEVCLEARDANLDTDHGRVSMSMLASALAGVASKRKLLVFDTCFAGGFGDLTAQSKTSAVPSSPFLRGEGIVVIASSDSGQQSQILHGDCLSLFTKHLVEGLRGRAALPGKQEIGVFELFSYVSEAVIAEAPGQHPVYAAGGQKRNFPVAILPSKDKLNSPVLSSYWDQERVGGLPAIFSALYPYGPRDREIWERAGGALAFIDLSGPGQTQWFRAIRYIEKGGHLSLDRLISTALLDFPFHPRLKSSAAYGANVH